jgi:propionyl-CoA carboxylase alpha chain
VTREAARVVRLGETDVRLEVARKGDAIEVRFADSGRKRSVLASPWKPGDALWQGTIDAQPVSVQVRPVLNGFALSHRGVETRAYVYTGREAAAAARMPAKSAADSGKAVRCPMPGLVIAISVTVGQEVKSGEPLAVVEAMKMENVLRAERDGVVAKINVRPGDSLAADAVILEFA